MLLILTCKCFLSQGPLFPMASVIINTSALVLVVKGSSESDLELHTNFEFGERKNHHF